MQLGAGLTTLESSLHKSLPEHLNSEIVLGAIKDIETARVWLRSTFLFQRIQRNPPYYGITKNNADQSWEKRFDELVEDALATLESNQLLTKDDTGSLNPTAFGNIASRSYVKQASMNVIINLSEKANKRDVVCPFLIGYFRTVTPCEARSSLAS